MEASVICEDDCLKLSGSGSIKVKRLKIKQGFHLYKGCSLMMYQDENGAARSLKCPFEGIVGKVLAKTDAELKCGDVILVLKGKCSHPIVMKDLCAECGADLRELQINSSEQATVSMIHTVPELRVNEQLSQSIGKADENRLLKAKKLVLLVDLDQTLIHTTGDDVNPKLRDVHHFQLYGQKSLWYHTRVRPKTQEFLQKISELYELHIVTFGARPYAHHIASIIDPEKKYFHCRILSRDECFNPQSKTANLKSLFPCGDQMVCIIDDREDVWNFAPNLIAVKPYVFFKSTGDINSPVGLLAECHALPPSEGGTCSPYLSRKALYSNETEREAISVLHNLVEQVCVANDGFVDYEDNDDYLLYLEEILTTIHRAYFNLYDQMQSKSSQQERTIPDLKTVMPYVRQKVLKNVVIVFTGCFPTNQAPENAKIYLVALSLGAKVQKELNSKVTHLVAARPGTAKIQQARRIKNLKVVSSQWLWSCAERWEHVPEKLFPLKDMPIEAQGKWKAKGGFTEEITVNQLWNESPQEARMRAEMAEFNEAETKVLPEALLPSLAFGKSDLDEMGKEVDDFCTDDDDESDEDQDSQGNSKKRKREDESSDDELYGEENAPRGWGTTVDDYGGWDKRELALAKSNEIDKESTSDDESVGSVDDEMAAAVERELMG